MQRVRDPLQTWNGNYGIAHFDILLLNIPKFYFSINGCCDKKTSASGVLYDINICLMRVEAKWGYIMSIC